MINDKFIVKEKQNLYRDGYSKAIVNTDISSLNEYKQKKKIANSVKDNEEKIQKLENDISEIKNMLVQLLKR
jgi:dephospho-CoA kinase